MKWRWLQRSPVSMANMYHLNICWSLVIFAYLLFILYVSMQDSMKHTVNVRLCKNLKKRSKERNSSYRFEWSSVKDTYKLRHSHTYSHKLFLLRSQLYLWGSPFWVRFLCIWPFFNPTTEVITVCLYGWCMLGVFLLRAFTRPGHECQDLLSPCDGMHVCTD